MGAVAITRKQELGGLGLEQGKRYVRCTLTPTGTYATGGDTIPPLTLGLKNVTEMFLCLKGKVGGIAVVPSTMAARPSLSGTATVPLIQWHVGSGTPTEVANATNLTAVTADVIFGGD
jgi:hypothetical protein